MNNDNELMVLNEKNEVVPADVKLLELYRDTLYPGASLKLVGFIYLYNKQYKVDIYQKFFHIVAYKGVEQIIGSIQLARELAGRVGPYALSAPRFSKPIFDANLKIKRPAWCKITVTRFVNGQAYPVEAKVRWEECLKSGPLWRSNPYSMLEKCVETKALKKSTTGMPNFYTIEEMGEGDDVEIMPTRLSTKDAVKAKIIQNRPPEIAVIPDAVPVAETIKPETLEDLEFALKNYGVSEEDLNKVLAVYKATSIEELPEEKAQLILGRLRAKYGVKDE